MTQEKSWSKKDQQRLIELYQLGDKFNEIATKLNRTYSAIASEVQELLKAGKLGYRKSNAEAAANESKLFKIDPVEFEDNGVMIRPSANDEETEGAEQAERAERKAITTQTQMRNYYLDDLKNVNTDLFMIIVKNAAGYYAQRTKSQIVSIFGANFRICEAKKPYPYKCEECYLNHLCNSSRVGNARENAGSWCAFDEKHIIKYQDDCPDSIRDTMKRFGTQIGLLRIHDKFNRIKNILDSEGKANFESAEDNLQDLATYAIMMLAYIKKGGNK